MIIKDTTNKVTKLGLICTKCFKKKVFDVELKINSSDLDDRNQTLNIVIFPYFKCACDLHENMEQIDIDIIDDIIALNKAGYYTSYSCSGHNDKPYGLYLVFKDWDIISYIGEHDITMPKYLYFEPSRYNKKEMNHHPVMRVNKNLFTQEDTESDRLKILEDFHTFVSNLIEKK